jgi:anti-sigma factor RsiW
MINHQTELKLQAYLDGELSAREAKAVADLLGRDAGAQALYQELRIAKSLLAGNELERKLPESREFYWSKIQRQINRVEPAQADGLTTEPAASRWWPRFLAPAGVLAALAVFVAVVLRSPEGGQALLALDDSHEIETPLEETSSFSFRSEAAAMTVVWVDSHRE